MSESRDRLERPVDPAEIFARHRSVGILDEQETIPNSTGTPIARTATMTTAQQRPTGGGGPLRRTFGTPGRSGNLYRSPVLNRENASAGSSRRSRARGRMGILPHWYPRTPLRDITAVARAIERRRARLREIDGQGNDSPTPSDEIALESNDERNVCLISPAPTIGKVPKILQRITNQSDGEEALTPQKKLLNSIDQVEKVVMEELQKLKRTPSAKKAEREKRVRTLMSMR